MTESMFWSYVDELVVVRSEHMLEAAQAAAYPHLTRHGAQSWWSSIAMMADRKARDERRRAAQENGIMANGRRVSLRGLKAWFQLMSGSAPMALQAGAAYPIPIRASAGAVA